jgi:hypothetical protein
VVMHNMIYILYIIQLMVHEGDEPYTIADAFVQRHAQSLWPTIAQTRKQLVDAIEAQLGRQLGQKLGTPQA